MGKTIELGHNCGIPLSAAGHNHGTLERLRCLTGKGPASLLICWQSPGFAGGPLKGEQNDPFKNRRSIFLLLGFASPHRLDWLRQYAMKRRPRETRSAGWQKNTGSPPEEESADSFMSDERGSRENIDLPWKAELPAGNQNSFYRARNKCPSKGRWGI